jgi:YWFCY protein
MQQEDDLRALAKIMDFGRAVSILFVLIHIYWFCYETVFEWGVTIGVVDKILMNFNRTTGLFTSILWTKLAAVLFLLSPVTGQEVSKERK